MNNPVVKVHRSISKRLMDPEDSWSPLRTNEDGVPGDGDVAHGGDADLLVGPEHLGRGAWWGTEGLHLNRGWHGRVVCYTADLVTQGVVNDGVKNDNQETYDDTKEKPDIHHLEIGCLGKRGRHLCEERGHDEQGREGRHHSHLEDVRAEEKANVADDQKDERWSVDV
ncbi:hypothetical protein E2C01_002260 [Portunus trituberculatus]|uniref:Uncharacterized protein n=1 Tax=Portunus trituberculatus TaxID=210409 RepID=A0A5B7CK43_PORTR|nr:hypothetical protein [Portunus trituberculatus]